MDAASKGWGGVAGADREDCGSRILYVLVCFADLADVPGVAVDVAEGVGVLPESIFQLCDDRRAFLADGGVVEAVWNPVDVTVIRSWLF